MKRTPLPTPNQNTPEFQAYRNAVQKGKKIFEKKMIDKKNKKGAKDAS